MASLADRIVGLDGVVAQQENYTRSGFVLAHRNVRFGGTPQGEAPRSEGLLRVTPDIVDAVLAYDRPFFPAPRETFLRCWLTPDTRRAFAVVEDGTVKGYGVIRACRSGYKIGPLFADSEREADTLFQALASEANGDASSSICPSRTGPPSRLPCAMACRPCSRRRGCIAARHRTCLCPASMGSRPSSWGEVVDARHSRSAPQSLAHHSL